MTLNEYQSGCEETAIYEQKVLYPAVGLVGEAGEVADKIKKVMRDRNNVPNDDDKKHICLELGDVFWYSAIILRDLGKKLNEIQNSYGDMVKCGAVSKYNSQTPQELVLSLCSQCSIASNAAVAGNENCVIIAIANVVVIIEALAKKYGYNIIQIAQMNLDKLKSRAVRDKIKGSGDDR